MRSVKSLSLPCYIASAYKSQPLVRKILKNPTLPKLDGLVKAESALSLLLPEATLPVDEATSHQKAWDELICSAEFADLKNSANQIHSARLLAASSPHTGAWLQALPSTALGFHLYDETTRIAVALRLGSAVCEPHRCRCGKFVNSLGHHGLACKLSPGRLP